MPKMNVPIMSDLPLCPVCGERPSDVRQDFGMAVFDPYARGGQGGTAVGTDVETAWAVGPGVEMKHAPDFDVITLLPCDHELRHGIMVEYRGRLREALAARRS